MLMVTCQRKYQTQARRAVWICPELRWRYPPPAPLYFWAMASCLAALALILPGLSPSLARRHVEDHGLEDIS